jgi:hypothetical protein
MMNPARSMCGCTDPSPARFPIDEPMVRGPLEEATQIESVRLQCAPAVPSEKRGDGELSLTRRPGGLVRGDRYPRAQQCRCHGVPPKSREVHSNATQNHWLEEFDSQVDTTGVRGQSQMSCCAAARSTERARRGNLAGCRRAGRSSLDIGRRLARRSLAVRARNVVADAQSAESVQ